MSYRNRRSVAVLGVPFDNVTMHEAMDLIEEKIEEQGYNVLAARPAISKVERVRLLIGALARAAFARAA